MTRFQQMLRSPALTPERSSVPGRRLVAAFVGTTLLLAIAGVSIALFGLGTDRRDAGGEGVSDGWFPAIAAGLDRPAAAGQPSVDVTDGWAAVLAPPRPDVRDGWEAVLAPPASDIRDGWDHRFFGDDE